MTAQSAASPRRNSSGLCRDIEILELLGTDEASRAGGLGVSQVAQRTGRDKAVISRTLATLAESGLVERDDDLRYRLGPRLYALAARTAGTRLLTSSREVLRRLVQTTRETSHLCVLRGGNVLTLLSELSPHEVRTTGWAGTTTAAWRTPSGRVLLSDWDDDAIADWYTDHGNDQPLVGSTDLADHSRFPLRDGPPDGSTAIRDLPTLRAELARIREQGFALSDEELESGVVAASAPVRDFTGRVVAAVNVSAPKARVGNLDALRAAAVKAAQDLSFRLGDA